MKLKLKNTHNFTLIELILSVGIIIVALVSFLSFFPLGMEASKVVSEKERIFRLANQYISFIEDDYLTNASWNAGEFYALATLPTRNIAFNSSPNSNFLENTYTSTSSSIPLKGAVQLKVFNNVNGTIEEEFGVEIRTGYEAVSMDNLIVSKTGVSYPTQNILDAIKFTFELSWPIGDPRYNERKKKRFERILFK